MEMKHKVILMGKVSLMALYFGLVGCQEESPLDSLKSNQPSQKYTESFWQQEQKQNSELWRQADDLCKQDGFRGKPNCGSIADINFYKNIRTPHKYGEGEGVKPGLDWAK